MDCQEFAKLRKLLNETMHKLESKNTEIDWKKKSKPGELGYVPEHEISITMQKLENEKFKLENEYRSYMAEFCNACNEFIKIGNSIMTLTQSVEDLKLSLNFVDKTSQKKDYLILLKKKCNHEATLDFCKKQLLSTVLEIDVETQKLELADSQQLLKTTSSLAHNMQSRGIKVDERMKSFLGNRANDVDNVQSNIEKTTKHLKSINKSQTQKRTVEDIQADIKRQNFELLKAQSLQMKNIEKLKYPTFENIDTIEFIQIETDALSLFIYARNELIKELQAELDELQKPQKTND